MTRLTWGASGERYFEAGADRGVLYLDGAPGVPWNGLQSVKEASVGGEAIPYFIDGYKYINTTSVEEFKATITAFYSPKEFDACDGTVAVKNGLFARQQRRKPFGLSYRTLVGDDTVGLERGYKINLVYNALASPAPKDNVTLGSNVEPMGFAWAISTSPPKVSGLRPTAQFVIDSRFTPKPLLKQIEDILYGSLSTQPRLPSVTELVGIFNDYVTPTFGYGQGPYGQGPYGG